MVGPDYKCTILAALLHDIGKLYQRAHPGEEGDHAKLGSKVFTYFFREALLRGKTLDSKQADVVDTAINSHHEHSEFVTHADRTSAGMDRIELKMEEERDPRTEVLVSVFSKVALCEKKCANDYFHKLERPLKEDVAVAFPEPSKNEPDYGRLWGDFVQGLRQLPASQDSWVYICALLRLLEEFTWCVPSAAYKHEPDISLYDHLRTTCAIAACLWHDRHTYGDKLPEKEFLIVVGDFSGIQKYIFDISRIEAGGVAKALRARSLFVNILLETFVHGLLQSFDPPLPPVNVILASGGKFYALLPNTSDAKENLQNLSRKVDHHLHRSLNAEVTLNTAWVEVCRSDLRGFGQITFALAQRLRRAKLSPLSTVLTSGVAWNEKEFALESYGGDSRPCRSCGKRPVKKTEKEKEEICELCRTDRKVGSALPTARFVNFVSDSADSPSFVLWQGRCAEVSVVARGEMSFALKPPQVERATPTLLRRIANYVPRIVESDLEGLGERFPDEDWQKGDVLPFDFIAEPPRATGRKCLAYLKADIDRLGELFAFGLFGDEMHAGRRKDTISRLATMSRMLDLFFCGWVNQALEEEFRDIYTVFSGGDDLLLVGPWNRIVDFAFELRREFRRFTCDNPAITLSTGIILANPHTPVSHAVEQAEDALGASKAKPGKDSITVFGETLSWQGAENAVDEGKRVAEWTAANLLSRGFLRNLLYYAQLHKEWASECDQKKTESLRWLPLMTYDIARNLPSADEKEEKNPEKRKVRLWAEELKSRMLSGEPGVSPVVIANYALNLIRGG